MKKSLLLIAALLIISNQVYTDVFAAATSNSSAVNAAIKKYKNGNYTGCLQDTLNIVSKDNSNAVAYYYMAMSFSKAGKKAEAIKAYGKVLDLKPNSTLFDYATRGKLCLEDPEKCKVPDESTEMDKMIAAPFGDGLSDGVRKSIEQKQLDAVKTKINSDTEINNYQLKQFKDYSNNRSEAGSTDKISQDKEPTNDEIVSALRVLNKAGLNPYNQTAANPYAQVAGVQNPEMAQLNMMMGNNQPNNNNNNAMLNMIPYMLAQKNGQSQNSGYNAQLMQTMMMNSMLPDFNFNTNDNK